MFHHYLTRKMEVKIQTDVEGEEKRRINMTRRKNRKADTQKKADNEGGNKKHLENKQETRSHLPVQSTRIYDFKSSSVKEKMRAGEGKKRVSSSRKKV